MQDKIDFTMILGGMTKTLQPLDVTVNKPVKDALRRLWNAWLVEGEHTFTDGGSMRMPMLQCIVQWIVQVWQDFDPSVIKKALVKCCIANAMDGTEDNALWNVVVVVRAD